MNSDLQVMIFCKVKSAVKKVLTNEKRCAIITYVVEKQLVLMTLRVHPFPYRTRKLSSVVPKIVLWRRGVKIGRCQHFKVSTQ